MVEPRLDADERDRGAPRLDEHEMGGDSYVLGSKHLMLADQLSLLFGRKFGILEVGAGEPRLDKPDLDILLGEFLAKRLNEALYAAFSRDIDRTARAARKPPSSIR